MHLTRRSAYLTALASSLLLAACGESPAPVALDAEADAADAADAASGRDAGARDDASFESLPDAGPCVEGAACVTSNGCVRGALSCATPLRTCIAADAVVFVERATSCRAARACDGDGACVMCGALGSPCCDVSCDDGLMCDASGTCSACSEGVACRPADPCRLGTQACGAGAASCTDSGPAEAGHTCGTACGGDGPCACTSAGACVACGGDAEPCCGTTCDDGGTCDLTTNTCFACVSGSACEVTTNACRVGVVSCTTGAPVCLDVANADRGRACGAGQACDGAAACVACGGDGQPCCGDTCGDGLSCHPASHDCFACDAGAACTSDNGCRSGAIDCSTGEARCVEDASVARGTSCAAAEACDGSGACVACGASGEPCCGTTCTGGAFCDAETHTCGGCTAGAGCTGHGGCESGTRACSAGVSSCAPTAYAARGTACGPALACDGAGGCLPCGGSSQPCCDGTCSDGLTCSTATGRCGSCPAGTVLVPGGDLQMGADASDASARSDERPVHGISMPAFCLDATEVTVDAYGACSACSAAGAGAGCNALDATRGSHPINCVAWAQASAFCAARGARLPTEAEWEYAARSDAARRYPWGSAAPTCALANFSGCAGTTDAVGAHSTGAAGGVEDLAGNVSEWVGDYYDAAFYSTAFATGDAPTGPSSGTARVIRGGGYGDDATELRATARRSMAAATQSSSIGFRCARSLP